jgi:glutaredoxin-related protein
MKGTPAFPQCGFSRGVVQVLNATDTKFDAYDVIADNELRNEIKVRRKQSRRVHIFEVTQHIAHPDVF